LYVSFLSIKVYIFAVLKTCISLSGTAHAAHYHNLINQEIQSHRRGLNRDSHFQGHYSLIEKHYAIKMSGCC